MKKLNLFGLLTVFMTAILCFSSCGKDFQDDIDDLNKKYTNLDGRVKNLESTVSSMNSQMDQLKKLAYAVEQGFYITQVKTTTDGYELTLNNGNIIILQYGG